MSLKIKHGAIQKLPENRFVSCLLMSDCISPGKFFVNKDVLRKSVIVDGECPVYYNEAMAGLLNSLVFGFKDNCLYGYGTLRDIDEDIENSIVLPEFDIVGVECIVCKRLFNNVSEIPCGCIGLSPCLILPKVCIRGVHIYSEWNEEIPRSGMISEHLLRQFPVVVDYIQIVDPI
jgi:hypothetical protein